MSALAFATESTLRTPVLSSAAVTILGYLRSNPLTAIGERILRIIACKFYQLGCCFAAQTTIANAIGRAKATIQRELDELECRGLIRRISRGKGKSDLLMLADGLIEALREMRLDRRARTLDRRGIPCLSGSFEESSTDRVPCLECTMEPAPQSLPPPVEPISQEAGMLRGSFVCEVENAERIEVAARTVVFPTNELKAPTEPKKTSKPLSQTRLSSSQPPSNENDGARKVVEKLLIDEGVTPARAHAFTRLFEPERIERNARAGLHRGKDNPPGYLLSAIQHDYAGHGIQPGSEAERGRMRENSIPQTPFPSVASPSVAGVSPPSMLLEPDGIPERFALLSDEQRAAYETRARESLHTKIGGIVNSQGAAFAAMVRACAVKLFRLDVHDDRLNSTSEYNAEPFPAQSMRANSQRIQPPMAFSSA